MEEKSVTSGHMTTQAEKHTVTSIDTISVYLFSLIFIDVRKHGQMYCKILRNARKRRAHNIIVRVFSLGNVGIVQVTYSY